jgi:hypothetical protein
MNNLEKSELEKIYIDLPNHWAVNGESVWAKALGNDKLITSLFMLTD